MVNARGVELTSIVSLAILLLGSGTGDPTWEDHDQRGQKLEQQGNYAAAEVRSKALREQLQAAASELESFRAKQEQASESRNQIPPSHF